LKRLASDNLQDKSRDIFPS